MRKNVASQRVTFSLFKNGARIANPTMAAGDFKVAIDGGAQNNVATLPTSDAAGLVTWLPTQAETNGDTVTFLANDVLGDEWEPLMISFDTRDATDIATMVADYSTLTQADILDDATPFSGASIAAIVAAIAALNNISVSAVFSENLPGSYSAGEAGYIIGTYLDAAVSTVAATVAAQSDDDDVVASTMTLSPYNTLAATISGLTISATWNRVVFTLKRGHEDPDAKAILQILVTNGGASGDGLVYIDQQAPAQAGVTSAAASLTVDQSAGTVTVNVTATAMALLGDYMHKSGAWDVKILEADEDLFRRGYGVATFRGVEGRAIPEVYGD